ncbi:MAG: hypothetical protein KatS3mg024_0822 [Armatimonadota bacterium]|nr:MAG: hypothetical protein KatS3mg024_0822 [Armatimonadota bacterium]
MTIGEVEGSGRVVSLWLTFPGWFWIHWDTDARISPSTVLFPNCPFLYLDTPERRPRPKYSWEDLLSL